MEQKQKTSRVGEIVLGIVGGIFGLIAAVMELAMTGIDSSLNGKSDLGGLTVGMFIVSIIAILLPFFISKNRKLIGWLTIIVGVGMFIFAGGFGILSGILVIIGGVLTLVRK